ncbi:hypothetical protein K443DRAFT_674770 [Laccaria amethystina LaAM-08-1]|uniref:Uncharacterized protein n=1 Tax=Laccaria amethystina LaAM-08-1 TaxID=1095629 RepID=A0A0C9Y6Y5_9AGAR|nr:hypothetical protein K443DRAFT_674770 [Laccaria amethystina LaAM-08-1]
MKGTLVLQPTSINCSKLPEKEDVERMFQALLAEAARVRNMFKRGVFLVVCFWRSSS